MKRGLHLLNRNASGRRSVLCSRHNTVYTDYVIDNIREVIVMKHKMSIQRLKKV